MVNAPERGKGRQARRVYGLEPLERRCLLTVSFPAVESYTVGDDVQALAVGDFNKDGWPDIAATAFGSVQILLNNKDGSFTPQATSLGGSEFFGQKSLLFNVDYTATAIKVADLTGNGNLDLVISYELGYAGPFGFMVSMGNGDGTFQAPVFYATAATAKLPPIVLGDYNGDGKPDIAIMEANGLNIMMNNGDGTFQRPVVYPSYPAGTSNDQSGQLAVGDFDGDGKPDLAVSIESNDNDPIMAIYQNLGNGTFAPPVAVSGLPDAGGITAEEFAGNGLSPKPADLNGAGHTDIVETGSGKLGVTLNDGKGGFTTTVVSTASNVGSEQPIVADFDGDGKPDIAVVTYSSGSPVVSVFTNDGTGNFGTPTNFSLPQGVYLPTVAVADFDRDGKPDLVFLSNPGVTDGMTTTSFGVLLSAVPNPKLAAIASQTAYVGNVVKVTAVGSDIDPNKTLIYSANVGTIDPQTGAFSYTVLPGTTGMNVPVTITATDDSTPPLTGSQTFTIRVLDTPPFVILDQATGVNGLGFDFENLSVKTGQLMTVQAHFIDPDLLQSWTGSVDFYDGTLTIPLQLNADKTFTISHIFASPGTYHGILSIGDGDGGGGPAYLNITVTGSGTTGTGTGSPPVRVSSIEMTVAKKVITEFVVQFDGAVTGAGNAANYRLALVTTKRVKKHSVVITKYIPIKRVSYNSTNEIVDIIPAGKIAPGRINHLSISASGILDSLGQALDGNNDGQPGGDLVASVGKSTVTIR